MQRLLLILLVIPYYSVSMTDEFCTEKKIHGQTIVEYTLPEIYSDRFNELFKDETKDPYLEWDYYRDRAKENLSKVLPPSLLQTIKNMRTLNNPTALIVHNMPIDSEIPPTPHNGNRPPKKGQNNGKGYVSEATILGVCSLLDACPDYDEREKDGTYINQIIPRNDAKSKSVASSFGSEVPFYAHTENVYQEPPLKFFSLLCLRGDPKVATSMIFRDKILDYIRNHSTTIPAFGDWVIEEMQKPQFIMKSGPSFENARVEQILPILTTSNEREQVFRFNANPGRMSGINETAEFIVDYLKNILTSSDFLDKSRTEVVLSKGDFLLFNNWEVMHARDSFKIDKQNWRWLQRCYFMLNEHKQ